MRALAAIALAVVLSGCLQSGSPELPSAATAPGRVEAAALLPTALAWGHAWRDDATLTSVSSMLGLAGLPTAERRGVSFPPEPLDGRSPMWGFVFVSDTSGRELTALLRADGRVHLLTASANDAPAEPAAARPMTSTEETWAAWLATSKFELMVAEDPEGAAWAGRTVTFLGYEITAGRARVDAWLGQAQYTKILDLRPLAPVPSPEVDVLRVPPAGLLEAALPWARAWSDIAQLDHVDGVLGDSGTTPHVSPPTRLDGRDAFWHFGFSSNRSSGLTITVSAGGEVTKIDSGDRKTIPRTPADPRSMNATEAGWERLLHSERLPDALAANDRTAPFATGNIDHVQYAFMVRGTGAVLWVIGARDGEGFTTIVDATTWTVMI